jgi:hypothetical protein
MNWCKKRMEDSGEEDTSELREGSRRPSKKDESYLRELCPCFSVCTNVKVSHGICVITQCNNCCQRRLGQKVLVTSRTGYRNPGRLALPAVQHLYCPWGACVRQGREIGRKFLTLSVGLEVRGGASKQQMLAPRDTHSRCSHPQASEQTR